MPLLPPVISATFPSSFPMEVLPGVGEVHVHTWSGGCYQFGWGDRAGGFCLACSSSGGVDVRRSGVLGGAGLLVAAVMLGMLLRDRRKHMANTSTRTGLQLRSTVKREGFLELSLASVPTPEPKPEEVIVRIDASPINPSDQVLLFGGADMSTAKASGTVDNPVLTASISAAVMKAMAGRLDQSLPVGNEGAGVGGQAGASPGGRGGVGRKGAKPGRGRI